MRVLIAENDPITEVFLKDILVRAGHEVTSVENGLDELRMLKDKEFDVLVTDVVMLGMSGLEVIQQADHLPSRVVVTTALGPADLTSLPENVVVLYKPYTEESLLDALAGVRA